MFIFFTMAFPFPMSGHVLTVCNRAGHYNEKKVKGPCNFGQTIQLLEREGTDYVENIFLKKNAKS